MTYNLEIQDVTDLIADIISRKGWMIATEGFPYGSVGFLLPSHILRSPCPAQVDYNEGKMLIEVTVLLLEVEYGFLPVLESDLYKCCNMVNAQVEGVTLVYNQANDGGESLELSSYGWVPDEDSIEMTLELILNRLNIVTDIILPTLVTFALQKPVVRIGTDGTVLDIRPPISLSEALAMMRVGAFGLA